MDVPIIRRDIPPAELAAPYTPKQPLQFVSPSDPGASSALTPDGERALKGLVIDLMARDAAWRVWATAGSDRPP